MPPTLAHGKICYVEIPAIDVGRSAELYERTFGWQARRRRGDPGEITARFKDPAGNVLGLCQDPGRK